MRFYIGMTGRKFSERLKEHKSDIKFGRETTALAKLSSRENIKIKFEDSRIIFRSDFYLPTIIRESLEITRRMGEICNESTSFNLDKLWLDLFRE